MEDKEKIFKDWEETYKKGQLTFWILLAIRDEPRYATEIREYINTLTKRRITCEDQSLYRALRRHHKNGLIQYKLKEGNKGPDRKYYSLTPMGSEILSDFTQKYIRIFYNKDLAKLLFSKPE